MVVQRTLMIGAVAGCLLSCASFKKEKSGAELRKEGYEALLKTVKPGMYRRQLYAVLPPFRAPLAKPPTMLPLVLTEDGKSTKTDAHMECHELDDELFLAVYYQLKNAREYGFTQSVIDPMPPTRRTGERTGSIFITPDVVTCAILRPTHEWFPFRGHRPVSKENPDDIIVARMGVFSRSIPVPELSEVHIQFPFQKPDARIGRPLWTAGAVQQGRSAARNYHEPHEQPTHRTRLGLWWRSLGSRLKIYILERSLPTIPPLPQNLRADAR